MSRFGRVDTLVTVVAVLVTGLTLVQAVTSGGPWLPAACTVAGCAAVLLRHRHPLAVVAVTTAGVLMVGQADPSWVSLGAMSQLALLHLVSTARRRVWVVAALATALAFCLPLVLRGPGSGVEANVAAMISWTTGAVAVGHAVRSRRDYVLAVQDRARRAEQMREAVTRRRVVEERLRIAREFHDVVGHHVAVINVHAGLARRALRTDPDLSEHALVETETAARAVLREMAGIRVLRADGDDTAAPGLDRVVDLVEAVRRGGVEVEARLDHEDVPDLVSVTGYRVVQEVLTNAARHGRGRAALTVRRTPEAVVPRRGVGGGAVLVQERVPGPRDRRGAAVGRRRPDVRRCWPRCRMGAASAARVLRSPWQRRGCGYRPRRPGTPNRRPAAADRRVRTCSSLMRRSGCWAVFRRPAGSAPVTALRTPRCGRRAAYASQLSKCVPGTAV